MQQLNSKDSASTTAISLPAARLSLAATVSSFILLVLLHIIKPEIDPSWRVISEYAIGDYGWLMILHFLSLAFSCVALFIAIKSQIRGVWGKIGLGLLLLSSVGFAMGGIFTTDPLTATESSRTMTGRLHEVGGFLDFIPFAALLINFVLLRKNPAWASAKGVLLLTAFLPLVGLIVFIGATAMMMPSDGKFGPDVMIGWPNRFLMVTYYIWFITIAWQAIKVHERRS